MSKYNLNSESDLETAKREAGILYDSIREVYCPYFKENISFNAKGWEHMQFKNRRRVRTKNDQFTRLKLLPLVPDVLSKSHTLQSLCYTASFELINVNSRWDNILKQITFWEFIAVLSNVRIRVVIKQVEGGRKHFFSVIPYWKTKPGTNERMLHGHIPTND